MDKAKYMVEMWAGENARPQNYYGKIIDQDGNPVVGATAVGTLMWIQGMDSAEKMETHTTQSDENGEFQFVGFHAWKLGIVVKKDGYLLGSGNGVFTHPIGATELSSSQRVVIRMWKLKRAEPLIEMEIKDDIAGDGIPIRYDLATGKKKKEGGDLVVRLKRNPEILVPGKKFDWTLTLEVQDGYQTAVVFNMPAGMKNWTPNITPSYYFKCRGGKIYGRINFHVNAAFRTTTTYLTARIFLNPAGSRNLEIHAYPSNVTEAKQLGAR